MSYPINQPITYTAVASTQGQQSNTFNYAWAFDDSTTASAASTAKTWATAGNHLATVTATDTTTLGTATAYKTISVSDWSIFGWTSSGLKMFPTASSSVGGTGGAYAIYPIVTGNYIVNAFDVSNPQTIVVIDSVGITRSEYSGFLGTVGNPLTAFALTTGPNSGKIMILGSGTARYGFFDPSNGSFVTSPNSTPRTPSIYGGSIRPSALMGNGKWFVHAVTSAPAAASMIYDPILDQWSNASNGSTPASTDCLFKLPSGKILSASSGTMSTYIYDYTLDSWSSGPTLPSTYSGGDRWLEQLNDGRIFIITQGSSPVQAIWREGDASFTLDTEVYPITSQYATATSNNIDKTFLSPFFNKMCCVFGVFIVFAHGIC